MKVNSLIVFKKGKETPKKRLLFSAHTDEVGMMVSYITDDGLLKIVQAGGIDDRVILGRQVQVGKARIPGVIGTKAVHQQSDDERGSAVKTEKMFVDIGCTSREEAAALVRTATQTAQSRSEQIILEAKQEAAAIRAKASNDIAQERKNAVNAIKNDISGIAVSIASKVVEKEIDEKDHEALIQDFINQMGEAV